LSVSKYKLLKEIKFKANANKRERRRGGWWCDPRLRDYYATYFNFRKKLHINLGVTAM
jgi:hypothetical protein